MKKIFAIALALVMVLSMASAFAMTCTTGYDWACATTTYNCGKASVEVVPFVRTNDACETLSNFVQSDCAAVVKGERVYYAIKLTIDKDLNKEWWTEAGLVLSFKNLSDTSATAAAADPNHTATLPAYGSKPDGENEIEDGGVFWYTTASTWVADKDFKAANCVFDQWAMSKDVKVCATLTSKYDFVKGAVNTSVARQYVEVADWRIKYVAGEHEVVFDTFKKGAWDDSVVVELDDDNKVAVVKAVVDGKHVATYVGRDANGFLKTEGGYDGEGCNPGALVAKVLDYFKLSFGTCVTEKALNANFGWDDKIEDCHVWGTNAMSVVDAECVVAIPKTGDASVLAWLF